MARQTVKVQIRGVGGGRGGSRRPSAPRIAGVRKPNGTRKV